MSTLQQLFAKSALAGTMVLAAIFGTSVGLRADQNVGIGTSAPDTSAVLDITSANKGLLVPRLTTLQRDAIVLPAKSLMIFNTTSNRYEYNSGTPTAPIWTAFNATDGWNLVGNGGTNPSLNFLGTTDAQPLSLRTSNAERLRILANGNVGIGTATAGSRLHVAGGNMMLDTATAGTAGQFMFMNPARTASTSIRAGAQNANISYTLPTAAPAAGQLLASDATGNMSWTTVNGLPNGGTNINSTLVWNGTSWVTNPNITFNGSTINIGGPTIQGDWRIYDGNGQYVSVKIGDFLTNKTYLMQEVPDSAFFVMTKGDQIIGGNKSFTNNVNILGGSELRWYEPTANGNNFVAFKAPALAQDNIYTLPNTVGTNGQVLTTDGTGTMNWTTVNGLPNGGTNINSTLVWNGTSWVTNPNITLNGGTINIGGPTTQGDWRIYDGNGQYVSVKIGDFLTNKTYLMQEVPDSAFFVMTKGDQIIGGNKSFTNNVSITNGSELRWYEPTANGNNFISFKAPVLAQDYNFILPNSFGTTGQVLTSDGAGNLSWTTPSSGVTGTGSTGQFTVWSGTNTITGISGLNYNTTNNFLGIGVTNPSSRLDIGNGNISITNNNNTAGEMRWYEPSGAGNNYTAFRAQSQSTNINYTLPATSGTAGQFLSITNGDTLQWVSSSSFNWSLTGNSGTSPNAPNNNFLGTADNQPLAIRTNNTERMRVKADGKISMGVNNTSATSNAFGQVQVNDNSTTNNYSAFAAIATGSVTSANGIGFAMQASKQVASVASNATNVGGYFIANSAPFNYGVVVGNGGDVYLGQVDSLTPTHLRNSILANGNPNRTYIHSLNLSGELVAGSQGGTFGPGTAGQVLISQGTSAAPQWVNPGTVFGGSQWTLDGNAVTTERTFGTSNNNALPIITNNVERARITADGRVGINTNSPATSAQLEINSTTRGALLPRMTAAQRDAITTPAEGLIIYVTTATEEGFWYYDGAAWLPISSTVSANSSVVTRRKTADESVASSATVQDDDHLFLALAANQVWEVEGMVDFTSASATPGAQFGFSVPAGASFKMTYHSNDGAASAFTSGVNDGSGNSSVQVAAAGASVVHVKGIVVMGGTAGDFRLRWAQNSANASATTARTNSYLKFTRIQ
ncbi:MAG: hypothetical protein JNL32_04995 [Candidatus Kapabacteria bacterium]|nr:hypothetical protein [Candidatus Kapabacteria bacterium]